MKIYTSYFSNLKKLKEANITPIGVARWKPRFFTGFTIYDVAPTPFMLSDKCSKELYLKMYDEQLGKLNSEYIIKQIYSLSRGNDVALCCYEKPGDFCHRHILAKWLTENTEFNVEEFGVKEKKKEPEAQQMDLF